MRLIKQPDDYGCGLACTAMLAGTTYADVRKTYREVCGKMSRGKVKGTQLSELKEIMRRHGVVIEGKGKRLGKNGPEQLGFEHHALIKMNFRDGGNEWHWAVWDHERHQLLDPRVPSYKHPKFISYWKVRVASQSDGEE